MSPGSLTVFFPMIQLSGASVEQAESDLTRNKMLEGEGQRLRGDYDVEPGDLHLVMQKVRSVGDQTLKKRESMDRRSGWGRRNFEMGVLGRGGGDRKD